MPIKKSQFPKLLPKVKGSTTRWNISVAKNIKRRSDVLYMLYGKQNCAAYGDTHIELNFLQLAILTSLK